MKETEDDTDEKDIYTMFLDWKNQYYLNDHTIKGNLQNSKKSLSNSQNWNKKNFFNQYGNTKDPEQPK